MRRSISFDLSISRRREDSRKARQIGSVSHQHPLSDEGDQSSRCDSDNLPRSSAVRTQPTTRTQVRKRRRPPPRIYDDPDIVAGYASVPLLEMDRLPRGGLSFFTKAVGRVQFGVPPETIKDSMQMGLEVPTIYILPTERFCRELGPALGINLAEFEFPSYFNYFIRRKQCTLVVDSLDAESSVRKVFEETLLGPAKFRNKHTQKPNEDEDFDPSFPKISRPNFYKEFYHFRTAEEASDFRELTLDMLLNFCHFQGPEQSRNRNRFGHDKLGVPPLLHDDSDEGSSRRPILTHAKDGAFRRTRGSPVVDHQRMDSGSDGSLDCVKEEDGVDSDLDEESSSQSLRRVRSDPNLKRLSLDSTAQFSTDSYDPESSLILNQKEMSRKGSMETASSFFSRGIRSRDGMSWADGASFMLESDEEDDPNLNRWLYSQAKWLGEVATVYPPSTPADKMEKNETARIEIFKMSGGTEYIVHDIDENNTIIGKARFSGTVRVPDEITVEGFHHPYEQSSENVDTTCDASIENEHKEKSLRPNGIDIPPLSVPSTFYPPSFGVTVLGNSHGFDKNGSVSGYVLWINGRGIMIDPPPYSSAALERDGIRPNMIVAIIITHCHADHDAGTFQKVMTGLRVAIITTPTIYKSFIRKYAALSGLNPKLLCRSHRHRPAIVGQPLRFQGAVFHFTYTLHTIPCIGFKVIWRGRSMVFTGDHLNNPAVIDSMERKNVLAKERADDLRKFPMQDCDVLLHEAGAPPIHTPLDVLEALPDAVRKRLYVVHTSALPDECRLRVAPTGTDGTIRIDEFPTKVTTNTPSGARGDGILDTIQARKEIQDRSQIDEASLDDGGYPNLTVNGDFLCHILPHVSNRKDNDTHQVSKLPPLVFSRPACVSDAWFILNLLSAVPFLSSLSFSSTMEVLEIAHIEMFCRGEVVVPADRRPHVLCVIWEGTCVELEDTSRDGSREEVTAGLDGAQSSFEALIGINEETLKEEALDVVMRRVNPTIWHAGDWTGPVSLQPDEERSSEVTSTGPTQNVVALSDNGVKVILLNMVDLHKILKNGSKLFRKYLALKDKQAEEEAAMKDHLMKNHDSSNSDLDYQTANVLGYSSEEKLPSHWNAYDSVLEVAKCNSVLGKLSASQRRLLESLAEGPRFFEAGQHLWQAGEPVGFAFLIVTGTATFSVRKEPVLHRRATTGFISQAELDAKVDRGAVSRIQEDRPLFNVPPSSEYARLEVGLQLRVEEMELDIYEQTHSLLPKEQHMRNARDRFANNVLSRLYSRRAFTLGLIFSRGHFLSDTSRMVSGSLAHINQQSRREGRYERTTKKALADHCHTSNVVAGNGGCAVIVFPRSSLVQFLDCNPGLLLSLLGTQVVV